MQERPPRTVIKVQHPGKSSAKASSREEYHVDFLNPRRYTVPISNAIERIL